MIYIYSVGPTFNDSVWVYNWKHSPQSDKICKVVW